MNLNKVHSNIAELQNISVGFAQKQVLENFSVNFTRDKITALLGVSGSGKSTILKMLNGMLQPDEGKVIVFEEPFDYDNANLMRLKIGYAVQQVGLFPHLTVAENVAILGNISKMHEPAIRARITALMQMVQLPLSDLKKYPFQLSGGEQQRVGLCRAFFLKPPLVLMDEPFASLDYKTKAGIYGHILTIQQEEPTSVIIVTHQFEEAEKLADEFIWIEEGRIKKEGSKQELKEIRFEFKERY